MPSRTPRYVVWDPRTNIPLTMSGSSELIRWAQMRRLTSLEVWVILAESRKVVSASMHRDGTRWGLTFEGETVWMPADPSDEPRVLAVVNLISESENETLRPVRYSIEEWPPEGSDVGARVGSMPPVRTEEAGHWEWRYCPEIIARATADLNESDCWVYVQSLDMRASLAVLHSDISGLELEDLLDDVLHEKLGRAHVAMLMKIRFRALTQPAPWEKR